MKPADKTGTTKPVKQMIILLVILLIVILFWCDSLQSFKAIAFMVHRVLILNILRHLFKNKEICTLDRLCVLIIKTVMIHIFE